jgi:hypothetical protein
LDGDVWGNIPLWKQTGLTNAAWYEKIENHLSVIGQVTWEQNWKTCCSLGMEPLFLESLRELQCLTNVTKNGTWKGNYNYWTGGTQKDCSGSWSWCAREGTKVVSDDVTWDLNQPDNKGGNEDCIHLKLKKGH